MNHTPITMKQQQQTTFTGGDKLLLPADYKPTKDVVIIGRGKKTREHNGNQRFYAIVDTNLPVYQNAATKGLKSSILWNILTQVRQSSTNGFGFVKKENGKWYAVDDSCARINIAQAFRDRLSYNYKSSKQHKSIKRKVDLGIIAQEDALLNETVLASMVHSDLQQEEPPVKRARTDAKLPQILSSASKMEAATPQDTFSCLLSKFGSVDTSEDPFEPKPIEPTPPKPIQETSCSSFVITDKMIKALPLSLSSTTDKMITEKMIQDKIKALPLSLSSASTKRLSLSLTSLEFAAQGNQTAASAADALLEDCFEMVNSLFQLSSN